MKKDGTETWTHTHTHIRVQRRERGRDVKDVKAQKQQRKVETRLTNSHTAKTIDKKRKEDESGI